MPSPQVALLVVLAALNISWIPRGASCYREVPQSADRLIRVAPKQQC